MSAVPYDSKDFEQLLETLPPLPTPPDQHGVSVVFRGGPTEVRQHALADLTEHATPTVHQFRMPSLLGERRVQTQNSLRKAFDHAAEEESVLYFDEADALFEHVHGDDPDSVDDDPGPTTVEYFLDRVDAYAGLVIVCLETPRHEDTLRRYTPPDFIVEFGEERVPEPPGQP